MRRQLPALFLISILSLVLVFSILLSIRLGAVELSLQEIIYAFVPELNPSQDTARMNQIQIIILKLRLPRTILALLVGASLAVSGAVYQGIFRNPLADPFILGISSGAALGVAIGAMFGFSASLFGLSVLTCFALLGGVATSLLVLVIAGMQRGKTVHLLLAGIAISFLMSSLIYMIMFFNRNLVDRIVFWTMGSFSTASWTKVILVLPIMLIVCVIIGVKRRDLNVMLLGDENAQSLGVHVQKTRITLLLASSLLTSAVVSVSGVIGFVGLITPHAIRLIIGANHKYLLPASFLGGAIFMLLADILARILFMPSELPIGVITGLVGSPYFLFLLMNKQKRLL